MRLSKKVISSRSGNLGILTLNNPKSLHSLTLDMVHSMHDFLKKWKNDETIKGILIKSSQDGLRRPVFCAGGDVKTLFETRDPTFFYDEYQLNHDIATTSSIPIISIWDGIVMGGGVGISIHGKYRIATENTLFAMPETTIGLFPDVGSMFWMPRLLPKPIANYLALTGKRIQSDDLLYTGLATHYVPSKDLPVLEQSLINATTGSTQIDISSILSSFHQEQNKEELLLENSFLARHRDLIEEAFNANTVEEILINLERQEKKSPNDSVTSKFAEETQKTLHHVSPTSLKLTLAGLQRGSDPSMTIGRDLQMEYRMASSLLLCTTPYL